MFSHVTVGSNDVARAKAFYDGVGKAWGSNASPTIPRRPATVAPADARNSGSSPSRQEDGNGRQRRDHRPRRSQPAGGRRRYKAGMSAGGKDEGAPGTAHALSSNYYGAYLRDPDGNKVCVVCHRPA